MNPTVIGFVVFACTFGAALAGMRLRRILPQHHFSDESKDTVKLSIGLIATMTALILGLVTASAKSSFDDVTAAVKDAAVDVLALDRTLARYGPETAEVRAALKHILAQRVEMIWPADQSRRSEIDWSPAPRNFELFAARIRGLRPQNEDQRQSQPAIMDAGSSPADGPWTPPPSSCLSRSPTAPVREPGRRPRGSRRRR